MLLLLDWLGINTVALAESFECPNPLATSAIIGACEGAAKLTGGPGANAAGA